MSGKKVVIDLFYDVISPYSWIAFEAVTRYSKVWPVEFRLRPFYLGGVMKSTGNRPPMTVPAKGMYMLQDLQNNNKYWGTNLKAPEDFAAIVHGKTTIAAQRMLAAISVAEPNKLEAASREFWTRIWQRGESIFEKEDFLAVANAVQLTDTPKIMDLMKSVQIKKIIADNVEDAIDTGAFGAPWFVINYPNGTREGIFGSDRWPIIAQLVDQPFLGPLKEHSAKL